jgi:hypothetical protein
METESYKPHLLTIIQLARQSNELFINLNQRFPKFIAIVRGTIACINQNLLEKNVVC